MIAAVVIAGIVPLVAFSVYAHDTLSATLLAEGDRARVSAARVAAGLLQAEFDRLSAELEHEAKDDGNAEDIVNGDRTALERELDNFLLDFPLAVAAGAFDSGGERVAGRGDMSYLEGFQESFAAAALSRSTMYVAHRPNGSMSDSIVVAMAVRDQGTARGSFAVALEPTGLLRQIGSWMGTPDRVLLILDQAGRVVTASAPVETVGDRKQPDELLVATAALGVPAWTVQAIERRATALAYRDEILARMDAASAAATASVFVLGWLGTQMYFRTRRQERALHRRAKRQAALLQAQSDLGEMLLVEEEGRLTSWNQAAIEMTGLSGDELAEIGSLDEVFLDPGDHLGRLSRGARMELQLRGSAGPGPWVELARQALPDESGSLVIARDITQRRALQGELVQRATHDPLTGLPNRALFEDRIAHATAARKRRGGSFSVLALDLDQFKSVNDMLGHHAGDELLVEVGRRLMTVLREQDMVARLGGDELALLVEDADEASAEIVVRRISEALEPSFVMQGHELRVSASIGIAVAPNDGEDPDVLLRRADMAMYEAKQQRGSHRFYDRALEERMLAQVTVVTELRRALEEGQFDLHYQPKISARTGQVAGIEALVRWQHPTRGLLEPADFVPHAVRARLGRGLDAWVLRNALVAARTWQRMGLSVPVSVNVGAETVEDPEFVDLVRTTLRTVGVDPRSLVLELTEDATLSDPRRIGELLRGLTTEGVQVSIDDFGTGYSSLLSVQHLPASELKIDRAFVRDLRTSPADQKIVRASTALARSLGMTATAEGVEDQETWDLLRELGCEQGQGYLFARPLPMAELVAWLLDRSPELDQDAIRRYADRLLQLAEPSEAMSSSERSARLEEEREGIRAIMAWAIGARETELALALSAGLRRYWCDAGRLDEASHWLGSALAAASDEGDTSAEATIDALNGLGVVLGQRGDLIAARALLEGCVDAARAIGADATLTRALTDLGVATAALGDLETAERCGVEAASLLGRAGQRVAEARQWNNIAVIRYRRGDHAAARELLDRALNVLGGQAEQRYLPDVLDTLGAVAIAEGDLGAAWHAYGRSLRLYRDHGVAGDITQPMIGIAVLVSGVRADLALRLMGAAEGIHARRGSQHSLLEDLLPWIMVRMERQPGEAACADELLRGRGLASDAAIDLGLACYAEEARRLATTERPDPAALERDPFVGSLIA